MKFNLILQRLNDVNQQQAILPSYDLSRTQSVEAFIWAPQSCLNSQMSGSKVILIIRLKAAVLVCQHLQHHLGTRCNMDPVRILTSSTLLVPQFKTLAFENQSCAQETVATLTAIKVETELSTSQIELSLLY